MMGQKGKFKLLHQFYFFFFLNLLATAADESQIYLAFSVLIFIARRGVFAKIFNFICCFLPSGVTDLPVLYLTISNILSQIHYRKYTIANTLSQICLEYMLNSSE